MGVRASVTRALAVAGMLAAATACGGGGGPAQSSDTSPIKIGVITSLTGRYQTLGIGNKAGIQIAVDEVNAAGGVGGRKLEVSFEDDRTDPTQAVVAFNALAGSGVSAIVGPVLSDSALAIKQGPLDSKRIPEVAIAASDALVDPVDRWLYMTPARASVAAEKMEQYWKSQDLTRIAMWWATDSAFATAGHDAMKRLASRYGVSFVDDEAFSSASTTDFTPLFTKLKGSGAQGLMVWSTAAPPVIITKAFKNQGLGGMQLFMSHAQATPLYYGTAAAGAAAEGVVVATQLGPIAPSLPDSVPQKKLALGLAQKYGQLSSPPGQYPSQFVFDGYVAVKMLVDAMKRKGTKNTDIAAGLDSVSLQTAQGDYRMSRNDHSGFGVDYMGIGVVKNGTLVATDFTLQQAAKIKS
jgi:branched-chain amino acid transport system substrate-binding protein